MPNPLRVVSTEELLKDDVNILKVGRDVFTLTKIDCSITQAIEHVQEHYRQRVDRTLADLNAEAYNQADQEASIEFNAIVSGLRTNVVTIPNDQREELRTSIGNALCPVRAVQYYVTAMRGRAYNYSQEMQAAIARKHPAFIVDYRGHANDDLVVTFQTTPVAILHYVLFNGAIGVDRGTFHAFRDCLGNRNKWFRLCTGNANGTQFWNQRDFVDSVRIINIDSPAAHSMHFDVPNRAFTDVELLNTFNYTYAFLPVNATTGEANGGWATGGAR